MNDIKFSVCVTTYQRWDLCFKALSSIVDQSFKPHEIILINDDPTSDVPKKVLELISENCIQYHRNEKNIGLAQSRNKAISLSSGHYFLFCDDDDYWHEEYLEKVSKKLLILNFPEMHVMIDPIYKRNIGEYTDLNQLFIKGFTPPVAAQCYNLNFLKTNNIRYSRECISGVDHDLWINLLSKNPKVSITFALDVAQQSSDRLQMTNDYHNRISKIEAALGIWEDTLIQSGRETELFENLVRGYRLYLERKFAQKLLFAEIKFKNPIFLGERLSGIRGLRNLILRKIFRIVLRYKFTTLDCRI